jgi:hypothetical protein
MSSAIRKWLVLALGVVAAIALCVPASAQAAAHAATAASSPLADGCFQNLELQNPVHEYDDEIDPGSGLLYFGGGQPHPLCQKHDAQIAGVVEIFTTSTGYCLANNSNDHDVYQHVPAGCTSAPYPWVQWKFIYIPTPNLGGGPYYELKSQYDGKCVWVLPNDTSVNVAPCDGTNYLDLYAVVPL